MLVAEPRSLLRKLIGTCTRALEAAASACISSRHYEVTVEHVLLSLLDDRESDVTTIFEFPTIWDLIVWVKPNPSGAFAEKNPNVHPSKT